MHGTTFNPYTDPERTKHSVTIRRQYETNSCSHCVTVGLYDQLKSLKRFIYK